MGRVWHPQRELYNVNVKKVMTDNQLEVLRRQISAYATISHRLVHMHNSIAAQQDQHAGMRLGNIYCHPLMTSSSHKIGSRQRWTPTPSQLQILEHIFDQGTGTPGKQKVKEITKDLSQHGPISETNVYNWFQNRRARSKRKHSVGVANATESEAEGEAESPRGKKSKMENFGLHEKSATKGENVNVPSPELVDDVYSLEAQLIIGDSMFDIDCGLRFSEGYDHVALFENVPRTDYLPDKMEVPEGFTHYQLGEEFDISG